MPDINPQLLCLPLFKKIKDNEFQDVKIYCINSVKHVNSSRFLEMRE